MAKGHTVRFYVADRGGRTSSTWRVWTNGRTADIYFGHREAAGEIKGSLHQSGYWQYGMTDQRLKTAGNVRGWNGQSRHLMCWKRPKEIAPGLTLAIEFAFLTDELQLPPSGINREGCIVIPAAKRGEAVLVAVFLAEPGAYLDGQWPGERDMNSQLLDGFPLPSGERAYLVHTHFVPSPVTSADLNHKRKEFSWMKDTDALRARFCSIVENTDGSRVFVEGAVHPDYYVLP